MNTEHCQLNKLSKKKIKKNGNFKKEVQTSMNKLFANGNSTYAYAVVLTGCGTIVLVV